MLKLEKLLLIFTDPKRFITGLLRYLDWLIIDKIFFLSSFLIFNFFPQYLYLLYNRKFQPYIKFPLFTKNERWIKRNNPEDEWFYKNKKIIFNEINIICRGNYMKYLKKINKKLPTFFVSFNYKPDINIPYACITAIGGKSKFHAWQIERFKEELYPVMVWQHGIMTKKNKIVWGRIRKPYPDVNYLKKINNHLPEKLKDTYKIYKKKKLKFGKINYKISKLISKKAIVHFRDSVGPQVIGSALGSIILLGASAKKVNVYGWDHWLKKGVDKYSYWKLIKTISRSSKSKGNIGGAYYRESLQGPWGERSNVHFCGAIISMHYASRLIEHKKYKIFSRLSKIHKQKKFLKNIEKIFFKN